MTTVGKFFLGLGGVALFFALTRRRPVNNGQSSYIDELGNLVEQGNNWSENNTFTYIDSTVTPPIPSVTPGGTAPINPGTEVAVQMPWGTYQVNSSLAWLTKFLNPQKNQSIDFGSGLKLTQTYITNQYGSNVLLTTIDYDHLGNPIFPHGSVYNVGSNTYTTYEDLPGGVKRQYIIQYRPADAAFYLNGIIDY